MKNTKPSQDNVVSPLLRLNQRNREFIEALQTRSRSDKNTSESTDSTIIRMTGRSGSQLDKDTHPPRKTTPKAKTERDTTTEPKVTTEQELRKKLFNEPPVQGPIRLTGASEDEWRRHYGDAMDRAERATDDLYEMLDLAKIDVTNLTAEQDDVIDLVKKELIKKSVLGTLTREEKLKIFQRTQQYIYNETTSANGDSYPVYVDIVSEGNKSDDMFPALGTVGTSVLSEEELKLVLEYGEQGSADEKERETFESMRKYKERVTWEAIYAYNKDLALGRAEPGDIQNYYDQAVLKIYDNGIKPIPITTLVDGKKTNLNVPIGELIPPYDNSFGAQVAREATRLLGLGYNEKAGQGYYNNMNIDCSKLVIWAVSEVNKNLGTNGLSKKAEYQMAAIKEVVWPTETNPTLDNEDLKPGDTLYWVGDESGEIKHTAIYIGLDKDNNPLMIEAGSTVKIVPLRKHTANSNGEGSTLYQINRMKWKDLNENAEKNKKRH